MAVRGKLNVVGRSKGMDRAVPFDTMVPDHFAVGYDAILTPV